LKNALSRKNKVQSDEERIRFRLSSFILRHYQTDTGLSDDNMQLIDEIVESTCSRLRGEAK